MNYEEKLFELAQADERFVCMTAENRALIRNLPTKLGERFIDCGITEQTMIGMAAGLALQGRTPIVHALATFLTLRAFEFIRTDVGISGLPVKLTGFIPGILSDGNGPTHQALEDISILRGIPNMQVFAPANVDDMNEMVELVWKSDKPAYIRANTRPSLISHSAFKIGKAETIEIGNDVTILTYGALFKESFEAYQSLKNQGFSVGIVNMRSLSPVDETIIIQAAQQSDLVMVIEDHFKIGGLYTIVAEVLLKHKLTANVKSIAFDNRWFKPASLSEVLEYEKLTAEHLTKRIKSNLENLILA
jgi:transketolase